MATTTATTTATPNTTPNASRLSTAVTSTNPATSSMKNACYIVQNIRTIYKTSVFPHP